MTGFFLALSTLLLLQFAVHGFVTPKSEFLLEIDGNGVAMARGYGCVIQQKHGVDIGGQVKCWGEILTDADVVDPPEDVSAPLQSLKLHIANLTRIIVCRSILYKL